MPASLLALALDGSLPDRLPPLGARRRSGAWPIGLLPIEALAAAVADRGVRYRRGSGFTLVTRPVDDAEVARLASVALEIAADYLWSRQSPTEVWESTLATAERDQDAALATAHRERPDDYEEADRLASALSALPDYWRRTASRVLESGESLAQDRAHAAEGDRFMEHAQALRLTAREAKAAPRARAALLTALRAHLPAPEAPTASEGDAVRWLASLDALDVLPRADLRRRYEAEGAPGDLTAADLRDLAAARWGEPRRIHGGTWAYRPARARRSA